MLWKIDKLISTFDFHSIWPEDLATESILHVAIYLLLYFLL